MNDRHGHVPDLCEVVLREPWPGDRELLTEGQPDHLRQNREATSDQKEKREDRTYRRYEREKKREKRGGRREKGGTREEGEECCVLCLL
jgi:hypothetical protein